MQASNVFTSRIIAPPTVAITRPAARKAGRPLADRLEWVAMVVLPLSSLVAAVSLLGQAIR